MNLNVFFPLLMVGILAESVIQPALGAHDLWQMRFSMHQPDALARARLAEQPRA